MSLNSLENSPKIFRLADGKLRLVAAVVYPDGDAITPCGELTHACYVHLKWQYI